MEQTPNTLPPEQTNLNKDPERTKMVAPKSEKKVQLRILRDLIDPRHPGPKDASAPILKAGYIGEFPLSLAKELVRRKAKGMYDFSGQRDGEAKTKPILFAEEYKEPVKNELDEE